jgi:ribosomal protein S18 acetylase RimI-like enzyme
MAETRSAVEARPDRAPTLHVRPGTVADIPAFRALGEAVVPPTYGPIDEAYAQRMLDEWWIPEVFEKSLARNAHLVAEWDGEVVALANLGRLSRSYRDFPHVTGDREVMWKLYVHPDHHGRGIGSRLLAEVESMVEGEELWLEVVDGNHQAYDFYVSRGFREVERVTDREWPDDIWLRKALGAKPR